MKPTPSVSLHVQSTPSHPWSTVNDVAWKKYALSSPIGPCVRRVWGTYHAGRISYLDVDPFEPSKCCVGAMFVLHPSAEIMLKFSYHHQVDGMVLLLLLLAFGFGGFGREGRDFPTRV